MMFGIHNGRGFGGTIDYARDLDGRHDKDARILCGKGVDIFFNDEGDLDANSRQLARSFRAQAMMNPRVKKCVKHMWISYLPEDLLSMVNRAMKGKEHYTSMEEAEEKFGQQRIQEIIDVAMVADAERLLRRMKYYDTQFLIVRHSEKNNPHIHVIINTVDNNGKRLMDFQEKKRGIEICKQISINNDYHWGDHKSVSVTESHNPRDNARAEICKAIFAISRTFHTAADLRSQASLQGIDVKYSTNYHTGIITGISFAKNGHIFPAGKVDSSLTAAKLFPYQRHADRPLSEYSEAEQAAVKHGEVVIGFNNQPLAVAKAPEPPIEIKEAQVREEYHRAIEDAASSANRSAYIMNIAGLALDRKCGNRQKRAEAISSYVIDETLEQCQIEERIQQLQNIITQTDYLADHRETLFLQLLFFLQSLLNQSLDMKRYGIIMEKERKDIRFRDLLGEKQKGTIRMGQELQDAVMKARSEAIEKRKQREEEAHAINPMGPIVGVKKDTTRDDISRKEIEEEQEQDNGISFGL